MRLTLKYRSYKVEQFHQMFIMHQSHVYKPDVFIAKYSNSGPDRLYSYCQRLNSVGTFQIEP